MNVRSSTCAEHGNFWCYRNLDLSNTHGCKEPNLIKVKVKHAKVQKREDWPCQVP